MRILILTELFDPEPAIKGLTFARALQERGHQVEVLTGFPNYPGGRLYGGYRIRPWHREVLGGIRVTRVALYPSHDRSALRRTLTYVTFALSAALFGPFLVERPDVIYAYHPPGTIGLPAAVLARRFGVPFVLDVQDLWPDSLEATGMIRNKTILSIVNAWCAAVYHAAAVIVVLSNGFKRALIARGIPASKIRVIHNWCMPVDSSDGSPLNLPDQAMVKDCFVVLFAGTMGLAQDLSTVLRAARLCLRSLPTVHFLFVGGGVDRDSLQETAMRWNLSNVTFHPPVPMATMGSVFAIADALLVHLRDDPLFAITVPSKTQAYFAAGKPLLMGVKGDAADLVQAAGAGITFEPGNEESLLSALQHLICLSPRDRADMGKAGATFYERRLSLPIGVAAFEEAFASAAGTPPFRRE